MIDLNDLKDDSKHTSLPEYFFPLEFDLHMKHDHLELWHQGRLMTLLNFDNLDKVCFDNYTLQEIRNLVPGKSMVILAKLVIPQMRGLSATFEFGSEPSNLEGITND